MKNLLTAVLLVGSLAACNTTTTPEPEPGTEVVTSYILDGNAVYPEGIAHLPGSPNFYVGSTTDGTIFKGTLGQAATEVLLPADAARPFAVGMKVDEAGRLYIAGGMSGQMFVYNTATKALIKSFDTPAAPDRFINDVALSTDAAYFTDSGRPTLFRVSRTATGVGDTAEAWLDLTTTIIQYQPTDPAFGPNLNGIVVTPDNKYLIVVQSNTGKLFRITIADKSISEINLGGSQVHGDGLLLNGQTLYAVAKPNIAPIVLSADFSSGTVGATFTDASLRFPTTIAQEGDRLLVVNAQFDKQPTKTPVLPFSVSSVAIPK